MLYGYKMWSLNFEGRAKAQSLWKQDPKVNIWTKEEHE